MKVVVACDHAGSLLKKMRLKPSMPAGMKWSKARHTIPSGGLPG